MASESDRFFGPNPHRWFWQFWKPRVVEYVRRPGSMYGGPDKYHVR